MAYTTVDYLHDQTNVLKLDIDSRTNRDATTNGTLSSLFLRNIRERIEKIGASRVKQEVRNTMQTRTTGLKDIVKENGAGYVEGGLEVSNCKSNRESFDELHSTGSHYCPIDHSMKSSKALEPSSNSTTTFKKPLLPSAASSSSTSSSSPSAGVVRSASISNEQENPSKRQKTEANQSNTDQNSFFEIDSVQQVRKRTFSHWPHRATPSQAQMIEAGFFNCNVGDRVICIYCNLICQQWTPHTDDPCEVHKTLSPTCPYVKAKLLRIEPGSIVIVNGNTQGAASNNLDQFRCNQFVPTAACNAAYSELPRRTATFATWPEANSPSVDDLVKAGFFYTGTKNIVTCFYCNGSLQNWGANDNPTIEHARWFPHCAYAKQLCGDELYRKIQESKRAQQERARANEPKDKNSSNGSTSNNATTNSRQLLIPDESTLSRLVAARLDLPVSQRLLDKNFKLSIIKRCFEDQLRLKHDDFATDTDLHMACMILQKQIEYIDGKKENIIIPSIKMKKTREDAERARAEALAREQNITTTTDAVHTQSIPTISNHDDVEMTTSSQSATNESTSSIESTSKAPTTGNQEETKATKPSISSKNEPNQTNDSSPANPCVLCLTDERRLACIPCGHLATCVPCGHSLRSCPICRREIEAFVRIYV